jgi:hypothetical protein
VNLYTDGTATLNYFFSF